jgi:UDPglucose 6-dehydrogenase
MRVCVYGLGHLGCVTAACLASVGHDVMAIVDSMVSLFVIQPEPGLAELVETTRASGRLCFFDGLPTEPLTVDAVWITFDTPVDDDDSASVGVVLEKIQVIIPLVPIETPILVSCQLPVGTIETLELRYPRHTFVCLPENLRHGTALHNFLHPDRVVVGVRKDVKNQLIIDLLHPITERIVWMTIESAEMTKHAINAWMAMSICFANEIASICEEVGADPTEVERGMRTEQRIGPKAYIRAGGPYEGRTLARDLEYLRDIGYDYGMSLPLLMSIKKSNETHRERSK